jgi:hypothetical protein
MAGAISLLPIETCGTAFYAGWRKKGLAMTRDSRRPPNENLKRASPCHTVCSELRILREVENGDTSRVVERPDMLTMMPKSASQKRGWFGGRQQVEGESNLRKKLLVEHIKFLNERFLEIEDEITKRSDSVDAVLEGLGNDKKKLCDNEEFVEEDDDGDGDDPGDDDGVLGHLTEILTGPILILVAAGWNPSIN